MIIMKWETNMKGSLFHCHLQVHNHQALPLRLHNQKVTRIKKNLIQREVDLRIPVNSAEAEIKSKIKEQVL